MKAAAAAVTFLEEEQGERSGFPPSPRTDLKKGLGISAVSQGSLCERFSHR